MNTTSEYIKSNICRNFCDSVKLVDLTNKLTRIEIPFFFPDGDPYQLYIANYTSECITLTDAGHTFMHLSYENDIDKFKEGTRGKIMAQVLNELGVEEHEGELIIETTIEGILPSIFILTQAITKIWDLTYLNKEKVRSSFYEDLKKTLDDLIPDKIYIHNYTPPQLENNQYYPIDFFINGKKKPLYIFGIANKDKARLTTIILERLHRENISFDSLLVFEDLNHIPRGDLNRLINAGDEMISSLSAKEDLKRKILEKAA